MKWCSWWRTLAVWQNLSSLPRVQAVLPSSALCSGLWVSWRAPPPRCPDHRPEMLLLLHATLAGWNPHLPPPSFQSADGDHVPEEATVLPAWVPGWPWEAAEIHLPWFLRETFSYWVQARSTCYMTGQWIPETRCWGQEYDFIQKAGWPRRGQTNVTK